MSPSLALLLALAQPAASEARPLPTYPLTDERLARIGDSQSRFLDAVQEPVLAHAGVLSGFRRIGTDRACAIYNRALAEVVAEHEPHLRPVLVAALRRHVPADTLAAPTGWMTNSIMIYHRRIVADLEANAAAVLAQARADLIRSFLSEAASARASDDAAGRFADWDVERPLARQMACMLVRSGPEESFARRKVPFDGFFRRVPS